MATLGIDFVNPALNSAGQKPLTKANWNNFVHLLRSTCLELPACYKWLTEYDVADSEFVDELSADLAIHVANGEYLASLLFVSPIVLLISGCVNANVSIGYVLDKCFLIKSVAGGAVK